MKLACRGRLGEATDEGVNILQLSQMKLEIIIWGHALELVLTYHRKTCKYLIKNVDPAKKKEGKCVFCEKNIEYRILVHWI